jgi:crossover junction endodeoxyribonuclease RuvC
MSHGTDRVRDWTNRVNEIERRDLASKRRISTALAPETPRILALDLMTVLGWACRSDDGEVMYGTETFETVQVSSPGMKWMRYRNWLRRMREEGRPEIIFFEEVTGFPPKNCGRDSRIYYGFEHHLTAFCAAAELDCQGVSPGTIKKFATGSGNASKADVILAMKMLGFNPKDSNQADAIALLLYAEAYSKGKVG